jgi:hypothetical protein
LVPFKLGHYLTICWRAKSEAKYKCLDLLRRGGLETAKYLIKTESPSEGYTRLYELGRLDLMVEAVALSRSRDGIASLPGMRPRALLFTQLNAPDATRWAGR